MSKCIILTTKRCGLVVDKGGYFSRSTLRFKPSSRRLVVLNLGIACTIMRESYLLLGSWSLLISWVQQLSEEVSHCIE